MANKRHKCRQEGLSTTQPIIKAPLIYKVSFE